MTSHRYIRDSGILNTDKNRFYSNIVINRGTDCIEWNGTIKKETVMEDRQESETEDQS